MMVMYRNIEERFCCKCSQNVGIEYLHLDDGSTIKRCLSKICGKDGGSDSRCFCSSEQEILRRTRI